MRAVASEYQRYNAAIYAFRDKYTGLPGDFRDATRFWGRQKNSADCITNSSAAMNTTSGVCDGNGDANVTGTFASPDTAYTARESLQAWRHVAAAGMIEGQWTGQTNSSGYLDAYTLPNSRLNLALWNFRNIGDLTGVVTGTPATTFALNYSNALEIWGVLGPIMIPQEAWGIDVKFDDGLPARGRLIGRPWSDCTTAAARTELDAVYNLSNAAKVCSALFFLGH